MSFRGQLQGFFFGFAIAGGIAMYQLQKDMWSSHRMIMASVSHYSCDVVCEGMLTAMWLFQSACQLCTHVCTLRSAHT